MALPVRSIVLNTLVSYETAWRCAVAYRRELQAELAVSRTEGRIARYTQRLAQAREQEEYAARRMNEERRTHHDRSRPS